MKESQPNQPDPLYVIFENHLYQFQDDTIDRKTFVIQVVEDYLSFLRRKKIAIPRSLEGQIIEELANQVHTLLIKKIYGFLTIKDFQKRAPVAAKRKAKALYSKLNKRA
ncbi:MAG: hypothetical protein HYX41_07630 [Bdellovibrio sp.]|nr:hypothetical protein [Bdellovibrio sp.]